MKMKRKITVEKSHITDSIRKDSRHCMIADAIKDTFPKAVYIMVDLQTIKFSDPVTHKRMVFLTPPTAQINLLKFDQGKSVKPFTFNLPTPVSVVEMRKSDPDSPRRTEVKRKAWRKYHVNQKTQSPAYLAANRTRGKREREYGLMATV